MNLWFTNLFPYIFLILFHLHTLKRQHQSPGIDSQTLVDKTKAFGYYCPSNALFGPVNFTEYPPNPDHNPWSLEDLQWYTRPYTPKEPYQIVCDGKAITVRIRPDTSCVTEMPWENYAILHNPNTSLMTLLASLDNELWLFKVWPPAKLPNQCKVTKICDQGTRIDANLNLSITQQPLDGFGRPNTHFEAKNQEC
ncbi:hypothetical protein DSO57_1028928 [Entomophthora muscae]|uniref:Uncharacterized protein n=1 Tax=Entomophthora muscae TaxID=34485 RepID=A0ACC2UAR1_9FUNG|nr:hypothetical protein DSO57_1028928 [Entomophthora muscae]